MLILNLFIVLCFCTYYASCQVVALGIVDGSNARIEDYPYQISIRYDDNHYCGGSIIDEYFVLSAAHCTYQREINRFKVHAGTTIASSTQGQTVNVSNFINHPNFNPVTLDYDVTVLILEQPLIYDETVQPIVLADDEEDDIEVGTAAIVTGWGKLTETSVNTTDVLQKADLNVISRSQCQMLTTDITERMICTLQSGRDACQGDSGGPLVQDGIQIGIVSGGNGCARENEPGVYANVANLRDFIFYITDI